MKKKPAANVALVCALAFLSHFAFSQNADWPLPGGQPGGGHFSSAATITPDNVKQLKVAWTHRSGDFRKGTNFRDGLKAEVPLQSSWQATPILAGDNLVICTPFNRIIAVNAATGEQQWSYTPDINLADYAMPRCRGVTQWQHPEQAENQTCHSIIVAPLMNAKVIGLDAFTGQRCHFGAVAEINLREGLRPHAPGDYTLNTPPAILGSLLITGAAIADNISTDVPSGVVRAYSLLNGQLIWDWEPVPPSDSSDNSQFEAGRQSASDGAIANIDAQQPSEEQGDQYQPGTSNVWSFISVDETLNRVYVPTGNTSPDYYGGHREGSDYYSSAVVALSGDTGEVVWHYQTVHHDIWDFDVPSQPTLFDVTTDGGVIHGLAQTTKQGYVFLLDRVTGKPLFPVIEQPVPQGTVAGDYTAATQPIPSKPRSLLDLPGDQDDVWGLTLWDRKACANVLEGLRYEGPFTPASLEGSLHMPSAFGGQNWGGPGLDPNRNILVVNTQHVGTIVQLLPREECGPEADPEPVAHGHFLEEPSEGTPYCNRRWLGFVSPMGAPCTPPPWGTLAGIDLVTGEVQWQVPLGTSRDMAPFPFWYIKGSPNIGGPVTTASGLTFIAATTDRYLRAFATETGSELWKGRLPTTAHGLPITYELSNGEQYVVVAAGGHAALGTPPGDHLIAFSLPPKRK